MHTDALSTSLQGLHAGLASVPFLASVGLEVSIPKNPHANIIILDTLNAVVLRGGRSLKDIRAWCSFHISYDDAEPVETSFIAHFSSLASACPGSVSVSVGVRRDTRRGEPSLAFTARREAIKAAWSAMPVRVSFHCSDS